VASEVEQAELDRTKRAKERASHLFQPLHGENMSERPFGAMRSDIQQRRADRTSFRLGCEARTRASREARPDFSEKDRRLSPVRVSRRERTYKTRFAQEHGYVRLSTIPSVHPRHFLHHPKHFSLAHAQALMFAATPHHLLHLLRTQLSEALDKVAVDETGGRRGLTLGLEGAEAARGRKGDGQPSPQKGAESKGGTEDLLFLL